MGMLMPQLKGAGATQFQGIVHSCVNWYSRVASRSDDLVHIQALPPHSCVAVGNLVNLYLFHHL